MTFRSSLLFLLLPLLPHPLKADDQNQARLTVHLLDYLAKDYVGAVGEDGAILSESEYAEQVEFAMTASKAAGEIPELKVRPEITEGMKDLLASIQGKAAPTQIIPLARSMQQAVLNATKLSVAPTRWPKLEKAAKLYAAQCAICHGATGAGDGPAGLALDPKPANFLDHAVMNAAAPLGEFHTIRLGVPGTGMAPFPELSDEDTWSLAAYVIALRHQDPAEDFGLNFEDELLKKSAILNDIDLAKYLGVSVGETSGKLAAVRWHQESSDRVNTITIAREHLASAEKAFVNGDFKAAKDFALRGYLEGIEPVEPRIRAKDPKLLVTIEVHMGELRNAIEEKRSVEEFQSKFKTAQETIDQADVLLGSSGIDSRVAFIAASGILLREGLEAALIILSLLSVIHAMGVKKAAYWVHGGWIFAVLLGVMSWFLIGAVFDISGAARELMEGLTSLFAVAVLIFVGFWLHRHSEIGRWTKFLREKVQHAVDAKSLLGLAAISFLAVFREAFETVLFLRVIWFDADQAAKTSLLSGVGITFVFILAVSGLAVRSSAKLPVGRLFTLSAYIMGVLAFILTGKGVHSLQESGWISSNPIMPYLRWELMGIYPSWETLLAQGLILTVVGGLWVWGKNPNPA